jgi:hypothetical protein
MDDITFNLLDPYVCSVDFSQQDKDNDRKCANVLSSSNPDKDYEFFWLTFKNSVIPYLGSNSINIKKFSNMLNDLQKEKKYDDIRENISDFMYINIDIIAKHILRSSCFVLFMRCNVNIARWGKIDNEFACDISDPIEFEWVNNIRVLGKMGIKKHHHKEYVLNELKVICTTKDYTKLFEYGVKNNLSSVVKMCSSHIDLQKYLPESYVKKYGQSKGSKLIRLIKNKIK